MKNANSLVPLQVGQLIPAGEVLRTRKFLYKFLIQYLKEKKKIFSQLPSPSREQDEGIGKRKAKKHRNANKRKRKKKDWVAQKVKWPLPSVAPIPERRISSWAMWFQKGEWF